MPTLPKNLIVFGASLMTAGTEFQLRQKHGALAAQARVFRKLVRQLARTKQGRADGIEAGMSYALFAVRVPPRTYEQFLPQIERMKHGEPNVLWPGHCPFYALTSGTTTDEAKQLPVTEGMLRHYRQAGWAAMLYYTYRMGHAGVFRGRHLFLSGSTTLTPLPATGTLPAFAGDITGIVSLNLPHWAQKHYLEPSPAVMQMTDWDAKLEAIAAQTVGRDITMLAGTPSWLSGLAGAVINRASKGKSRPCNLRAVWPNLECVVHGGVPIGPFAEELRLACGPGVTFHEVYAASEGFIATQDRSAMHGLRLMADMGLFFEFLPLADYDEYRLAILGPKVVSLEGVQAGIDYVLLLTTPAGLTRYVIGDVVRFLSITPPRLIYVGRTQLQLNAFDEHVIEKEISDALTAVCQEQNWNVVNFHVAPYSTKSITGQTRGRHEWWVELRPGTAITPTGTLLETQLDAKLQLFNPCYAAKRKDGLLLAPSVRLVMPGTFEYWMRRRGKWGGHSKMPRCRSDRLVADELAQLTRFRPETAAPWNTVSRPSGR
jgi:hypothetical protein